MQVYERLTSASFEKESECVRINEEKCRINTSMSIVVIEKVHSLTHAITHSLCRPSSKAAL